MNIYACSKSNLKPSFSKAFYVFCIFSKADLKEKADII